MKLKIALFIVFIYGGLKAQWTDQTNRLPTSNFTSAAIDAVDNQTAVVSVFITGQEAQLYKTLDGGDTWFEIPSPGNQNQPFQVYDLTMVGSSALWVCTAYPGKIFFTGDDGATWEEQFYDSTVTDFINYIEMFDASNGVAMGDAVGGGTGPAIILKTTDGGANWVSVNDSAFGGWSGDLWRRIDFTSPNVGYFFPSGSNPQLLYKTVDGGSSWVITNHPVTGVQVLKFFDEYIGFTANGGSLYRTLDGGVTWDYLASPSDRWGMDIEFAPEDSAKLWLASGNDVYFSADFGNTWVHQLTTGGTRDIVFTDSLNGWVLSDGGLYHTSNGGQLKAVADDRVTPDQYVLYHSYPNPFNAATTIRYSVPQNAVIEIAIYNLVGEKITTLISGTQEPGDHSVSWGGRDDRGNLVSTGIYFYVLSGDNIRITKKLIYLK